MEKMWPDATTPNGKVNLLNGIASHTVNESQINRLYSQFIHPNECRLMWAILLIGLEFKKKEIFTRIITYDFESFTINNLI